MLRILVDDLPRGVAGPGGAFTPGSVVSGTLAVTVQRELKCNSIRILLKGKGYAKWYNKCDDCEGCYECCGCDSCCRCCRNCCGSCCGESRSIEETYVSLERIVWRKQDSPNYKLDAGLYNFPFQFELPRNRTFSSFDEQFGWIRYYIQAKIDTGILGNLFSRSQNITEASIATTEIVDVNSAILCQPVQIERQKTATCFSCMSGSITMTVTLPKSGYYIGEMVPLQVSLVNGSNQEVRIVAVIEEGIDFFLKGRRVKYYDHKVIHSSAHSDRITPQANLTWSPQGTLFIPQSTPPTLNAIIIMRYFTLRVTLKGGYSSKTIGGLSVDIPVTIGNVPSNFVSPTGPTHLAHAVNQSPFPLPSTVAQGGFPAVPPQAFEMYPSAPSLDIQEGEKATLPVKVAAQDMLPYQNIPPPTYEEALKS